MKQTTPLSLARRHVALPLVLASAALAGCATTLTPAVYQKNPRNGVPSQRLAKDIEQCRARAQQVVGLNGRTARSAAQDSGRTGVVGFAATAAAAIANASDDAMRRARAAAAAGITGVAVSTALEWNDPDGVHLEYVERCLEGRGHDVLGWR